MGQHQDDGPKETVNNSEETAMSDLPSIFGHDPLKLLAEEASPALIHHFIDTLYEIEYDVTDRRFPFQMLMIAALMEHTETYPLNAEYEKKFLFICECVKDVVEGGLAELQARSP
ncbi:hypothetical protein N836_00260 [Leptolyngbya sp. Heron Island J]|uniref:hypothetical protein n=1 Tax=Leptolyngbya sp. Heron Island J TaxID=1385935 RepID=UPI0003B988B7|nr:hypothetical protein [Leptolyngbya sp. Heron Island J]ESA37146.1 hypothetical protein N836_00260 [Leptolyngbya sp. Heron Island J]